MGNGTSEARVEGAAHRLLQATAATVGTDYFHALARGVADVLGAKHAFVASVSAGATPRMKMLACWTSGSFSPGFEVELEATPAREVLREGTPRYFEHVCERFPQDALSATLGIFSYLGIPVRRGDGEAIGLVGAMHHAPMPTVEGLAPLLSLLAERAGREMDRMQRNDRSNEPRAIAADCCPDGLWMFDREGKTSWGNARMSEILGCPLARLVGRPAADFVDPRHVASLAARVLSEPACRWNVRLVRNGTTTFWADVTSAAATDASGVRSGTLWIVREADVIHPVEQHLRRIHGLESVRTLAAGSSLEIAALLERVVAGLVRLGQPQASIGGLSAFVLRAQSLAQQLSVCASERNGTMAATDIGAMIEQMVPSLQALAAARARIEVSVVPATPKVAADGPALREALVALVKNGCEAAGGEPGAVCVGVRPMTMDSSLRQRLVFDDGLEDGECVCLMVEDNGCGMSKDTLARAFDPFFTTKPGASGLGLGAVLDVMRSHCGAIALGTSPGKGTRVHLFFPSLPRRSCE